MPLRTEQLADLTTIGNGAALEKFAAELERVLANIKDPNTDAEAVRGISLTLKFKPTSDREAVAVAITAQAKLASTKATSDTMFLARTQDGLVATVVHGPKDDEGIPVLG